MRSGIRTEPPAFLPTEPQSGPTHERAGVGCPVAPWEPGLPRLLPVTWWRTNVLLPPPAPFLRTLSDFSPCQGGGELAGSHENCDRTCQQCQKSVNPPYPFLFLPPGCRKDLDKPTSGHWGPGRRVSLNHFASRQLLVGLIQKGENAGRAPVRDWPGCFPAYWWQDQDWTQDPALVLNHRAAPRISSQGTQS